MTVAELIAILEDYDEDLVVTLGDEELHQVTEAKLCLVRRVGISSYVWYDSPDGQEVVALC